MRQLLLLRMNPETLPGIQHFEVAPNQPLSEARSVARRLPDSMGRTRLEEWNDADDPTLAAGFPARRCRRGILYEAPVASATHPPVENPRIGRGLLPE